MKRYQPLVLQKLNIRVPGIHVRQLALHRHLPETTGLQPHAHKYAQCLLYLTGQGTQQVGDRAWEVKPGTAVFLPPHVKHAFRREANRRPICLVVDFDWRGARRRKEKIVPLSLTALREARQQISFIAHGQQQGGSDRTLTLSAAILNLLDQLLVGLALAGAPRPASVSPVLRKVESLLADPRAASLPLEELAQSAGYQHDYLNRLVKAEVGLSLGQFRAKKIQARAEKLLVQAESVAAVAEALGFGDPNYFSRWFRRQTGLTPSAWRKQASAT